MSVGLLVLIVLIIFLFGGGSLGYYGGNTHVGHGGLGIGTLLVIIVVILLLTGRL